MPKRDQFFADLAGDNRQAALLIAQVGGMPGEIQLVVQVADYVEEKGGLRPIRTYIIRVLGALEHRVSNLGTTSHTVALLADHPLLHVYTQRATAVFFRGRPHNADALVLDIAQAHASLFQGWRHFPDYLNVEQPLASLLTSGGGLLGQMPESLAVRLEEILLRHGLEVKLLHDAPHAQPQGPMKDQTLHALLIGESYFISYAFSFEEMGKV
jgi:hypothetical protein